MLRKVVKGQPASRTEIKDWGPKGPAAEDGIQGVWLLASECPPSDDFSGEAFGGMEGVSALEVVELVECYKSNGGSRRRMVLEGQALERKRVPHSA